MTHIDPQAKFVLNQLEAAGGPPLHTLIPEQARLAINTGPLAGPMGDVEKIENRTIPGFDGDIPIRIYTPKGHGHYPALVYFHGGGWVIGNLETVDAPCSQLASLAECVVISVDYRLAPEHKFPAATDDAYAAVKWVIENASSIQVDASKVAVGGDSAGGNLAAAVALMAKDKAELSICYQMLIYPATNYAFNTASYSDNAEGYFLTKDTMVWFWNHYLRNEDDGKNPYVSPLLAEDLSGLPPALVITAELDPLRDEGEAYVKRLQEADVEVEFTRYEGMIHGFYWMAGVIDQGKKAIRQSADALKRAFS